MSVERHYGLCQRYKGRAVEIRTRDGRVHRGVIQHTNNHTVFIRPIGGGRNLGGFGYGGFGIAAFGFGIALGSIATIALLPFAFW